MKDIMNCVKTENGIGKNNMNTVLCGANSYKEKYYLNPNFNLLPTEIKNELKWICIRYTEEAGGIITLEFDENGNLLIQTMASDSDFLYDEIESGIQVSKIQRENEELLSKLEFLYKSMGNINEI